MYNRCMRYDALSQYIYLNETVVEHLNSPPIHQIRYEMFCNSVMGRSTCTSTILL